VRIGRWRSGEAGSPGPPPPSTRPPRGPVGPPPTEAELALLRHGFASTPSLFSLLSTLRTRRVGLGYRLETGEEELLSWSSGRRARQPAGPLRFASEEEPLPLSEVEEALVCWAAAGPNGLALADVAVHGGLAGTISRRGRTVPASSGDLGVDLFVVNDAGVSCYRPVPDHPAPLELRGLDDVGKVLEWYREGRIAVSDRRPDLGWPGGPEGTHGVAPLGPGQYNLNRPGSTWFLPVGDVGLEWFNQLLVSYEWSGFYLMDPDSGEPAGCREWIRPGFLEVGFPIPAFDELALLLHAGQAGAMAQNIRLACEAIGLGAWLTGSYADDLVLGAYPDIARGLGFSFLPRDPARNPSATATCLGLPGVKDAVVVPSPRFPDAASAVRYVRELRYGTGGALAVDVPDAALPFRPEVYEAVVSHPRSHLSDWAEEAAVATVEHIVDRYGCCPAFVSPVRAKLSVQAHHLDQRFYRKIYAPGHEPYPLTEAILAHDATWHGGAAPAGPAGTEERS
jgi:hypothetical protein